MKTHEFKIEQKYFEDIISGKKTFEIKKNDRNYQVGDTIRLNEFADDGGSWYYTGDIYLARISYITNYEQKDGYVVLGIVPVEENE